MATGIKDCGQIAGFGTVMGKGGPEPHAFLLTQVSAPTAHFLAGTGLLVLLG